jgi:hypothetical protein
MAHEIDSKHNQSWRLAPLPNQPAPVARGRYCRKESFLREIQFAQLNARQHSPVIDAQREFGAQLQEPLASYTGSWFRGIARYIVCRSSSRTVAT